MINTYEIEQDSQINVQDCKKEILYLSTEIRSLINLNSFKYVFAKSPFMATSLFKLYLICPNLIYTEDKEFNCMSKNANNIFTDLIGVILSYFNNKIENLEKYKSDLFKNINSLEKNCSI